MKKCSLLLFIIAIAVNGFAQDLKDTLSKPFVVLELFTSEGCSSCPPAEKLLSKILNESQLNDRRIFPLEFHVDYWNKYGWKDPYSSVQYSRRQKRYVDLSPEKEMYTPQMVVNGKTTFLGSDEGKANDEIDRELKTRSEIYLGILKNENSTEDTLIVDYQVSKINANYFLNLAIVERGIETKIDKGENSGKKLKHDNVVRYFTSMELDRKKASVKLPLTKLKNNKNLVIIAFVQHKQNYHILAADQVELSNK